ncbi:2-succinyl-5-enolpyruvyl-6-hydroxy-3-cyclohexene-1-carboxylic-acid synthase [Algoriphagus namhaensis]
MILETISHLVAICADHGITHAILSPGSRCAPLTLAFARHPKIHTRTISDERSAAFIAMGMAQQLQKPVVLVCTSGSAALNYYPAIAEAYFQQIPLLVLTADRPPEWIDQYDGQTIFQDGVYGKHVKKSFSFLPESTSPDALWQGIRTANEAIHLAEAFPQGPVHINVPLREPFYPENGEEIIFPKAQVVLKSKAKICLHEDAKRELKSRLRNFNRILLVCGQERPNPRVLEQLDLLSKAKKIVVISDSISNFQSDHTITLHDHWLGLKEIKEQLSPDLILSFGKSIISKSLKLFLRGSAASHWHISPDGTAKDTFQRLTRVLCSEKLDFFTWLLETIEPKDADFHDQWHQLQHSVSQMLPRVLSESEFGEYPALQEVVQRIPPFSKIHVANSMAVRYLNFLGKRSQEIICNRGTSGIDGSNSTAVGCTFTTKEPVTLITGDLAFFYDRNAFWHNYSMPNLRIILLNNHAGGIFRLIDGPSRQPELEEFFETKQSLSARNISDEFGFGYVEVKDRLSLQKALEQFYSPSIKPKLLEITTESKKNADILAGVKDKISRHLLSYGFWKTRI